MDNRAEPPFQAEHGFSLWIEYDGCHILFDTGQTNGFMENAARLGIDVTQADYIILSHGHYDHTGGLPHVLPLAKQAVVVCHPGVFVDRYSIREGETKYIGMPPESRRMLRELDEKRLRFVTMPTALSAKIFLTGYVPRKTDYEDTGGPFYLTPDGASPDPLDDDLTLWLSTDRGIILLAGCSHAGIINQCYFVRKQEKSEKFRILVGGYHLMNADEKRLNQTINALRELAPEQVVACHCTGEEATTRLQHELGAMMALGAVGRRFLI